MISRRTLLAGVSGLAGYSLLGAPKGRLKIGVTNWNLKLTCKIEAIALAKTLGFDGVQVSIGRAIVDEKMPMDLIGFILAGIFWGGVSLITPCVFPMIPFTVSYFLNRQSGGKRDAR